MGVTVLRLFRIDKFSMNARNIRSAGAVLTLMLGAALACAQGPPYQTDDPVPVDLHHYEFYVFGAMDGTPVALASVGPAFEFNWGAIPRVQIHAILPWGASAPLNDP